jgi:hypothetical protein
MADGAYIPIGFEWWEVFLGGVATLAIFSFLYKENPFYRLFEHLYIGLAVAIGSMATIRSFFWPKVLKPMLGYDRVIFPDGSYSAPYDSRYFLFIIPMAFGSLYYFILSKRHNWLAQLVLGFSFGTAAGASFQGTFNEMLPQLYDSFKPLYVAGNNLATFNNLVFLTAFVTTMTYFFFTFRRRPGGKVEKAGFVGRYMMMICFGAYFGSTIMARMALLVERLEFLINRWWPLFT